MTSLTSTALYFGKIYLISGWCGNEPRWPWGPHNPPDPNPWLRDRPPPLPWLEQLKYGVLGGLLVLTAATHPEETWNVATGPFLVGAAVQIVIGSFSTRVVEREREREKSK